MNIVKRCLRLPRARWLLLASAALHLTVAAWQVRVWPFARLSATLGPVLAPSRLAPDRGRPFTREALAVADDVRWAIAAWARRLPWAPTCLMQAVAARGVLLRHGITCHLFLGVRGSGAAVAADEDVAAHAWLRCGPVLVTGEREAAHFAPIAVYCCTPGWPAPAR
jgi:hypothetical protein